MLAPNAEYAFVKDPCEFVWQWRISPCYGVSFSAAARMNSSPRLRDGGRSCRLNAVASAPALAEHGDRARGVTVCWHERKGGAVAVGEGEPGVRPGLVSVSGRGEASARDSPGAAWKITPRGCASSACCWRP